MSHWKPFYSCCTVNNLKIKEKMVLPYWKTVTERKIPKWSASSEPSCFVPWILFCPRKRAVGSYEMTNWSHFPWSWDQSSSASNPRNVDCAFPFEEGVSRNLHSSNSLPRPISDDFDYVIHQDPRLVDHSPMIPWSTYSRVLLPTAWSASANDWYWGRRWLQGDSGHLGGCWSSNPWIGQSISLEEESMTQNLMRTRTALWGSGSDPKAAFFDIFRWVWLSSNGSCGWMDHGLVKKMTWEMESPGNPAIFFQDCGFIQCEIPGWR